MLEVIEQFVEGKAGDPTLCEDILHISENYIGIIDGSSIKGRMFGEKTSGRFIAEAIDNALSTLPADCDIEEGTNAINRLIREKIGYSSSGDVMKAGARPAASVAILSRQRQEVWCYGDTLLNIDGVDFDLTKKIDHITTAARCAFVNAQMIAGRTVDELQASTDDMKLIEPLLALQQSSFLNNVAAGDLGYGNIDGADEVLHFTRVISVQNAQKVLMGSDGYLHLKPTCSESEKDLFDTLAADPLMVRLHPQVKGLRPGQKTFDDRMYVRLERR